MEKRRNTKPAKPDKLLEIIVENFRKIREENKTITKYQQVKEAIKKSLHRTQRDERLPSIRTLSGRLHATPVPIQHAITELIAEDLLYSQNGVGLFVKQRPPRNKPMFTGHRTMHKIQDIGFLFNDPSNAKRKMMLRIIEKYRENNQGSTTVKLMFEKPETDTVDLDLSVQFECFDHYLDLSDFSKHEIERGDLKVLGKFGGILAYISYYLFFNVECLDALGIRPPSYKSFKEQQAYILYAKQIAERKGVMGPASWNRPQYFLGKQTLKVIEFLKGNASIHSPEGKRILEMLKQTMDYYGVFEYEGSDIQDKPAIECFFNAETPIFTGDTNCFSILDEQRHLGFKWNVYPLFSYDNTLPLQPIYATVNGKTRLPMECVKFLKYLQGIVAQKEFYNQGFITVQRKGNHLTEDKPFTVAAQKSFSGYLEESVDNYIFEHIIDSELMECETRKKDVREAFENIVHYSKGYLRHFTD